MEDMLNVAEAKTRLIQELSEITGFKYLKSGVLKKTVKDIVFEINFFSSKWNESGQSIEINAELRLIYKTYGKLPVDNVVASMSYQPENCLLYTSATGIKQPSKVGKDRSHLLTGILKCPLCGSSMYTNKHAWTNKDGTRCV